MTNLKEPAKRERSLPSPQTLLASWSKNSPLTTNICDVYVCFSSYETERGRYRLNSYMFTSFDLKGEVMLEVSSLSELDIMQYLREVKKEIQKILIERKKKEADSEAYQKMQSFAFKGESR